MNDSKEFSVKAVLPSVLVIALGMMMVMMDTTIMNVALPHVQQSFGASLGDTQWAVTAYTLAMAAVIPFAGWLTDRFSAKCVFMGSVVLFSVASVLVAFSQSLPMLVASRVLQGLAGGVQGPVGIAMTFRIIPVERRGSMMGIIGLPMLLAPMLGPVISGWMISIASWHETFLINIPLGVLAFLLAAKLLPADTANKDAKIDALGAVLSPLAFPMVIFGIKTDMASGGSDILGVVLTIIGAVLLVAFVVVELRHESPLLEFSAFKTAEFTKGMLLMWTCQLIVFGTQLLVPMYLQTVLGFESLAAGLMMMPQAICSFIGMTMGGFLYDRFGTKAPTIPGFVLIGASITMLLLANAGSSIAYMVGAVCLLGIGAGLVNMQVNNHALQSVPLRIIAHVTPLSNEMQQVVNSLSVALLTTFLSLQVNGLGGGTLAMVPAYHNTFMLLEGFVAAGLVLTLFLKKRPLSKLQQAEKSAGVKAPTASAIA